MHMLNNYRHCPHSYTSTCTHVLTSDTVSERFPASFGGELTADVVGGGTGGGTIRGTNGDERIPGANAGGGRHCCEPGWTATGRDLGCACFSSLISYMCTFVQGSFHSADLGNMNSLKQKVRVLEVSLFFTLQIQFKIMYLYTANI